MDNASSARLLRLKEALRTKALELGFVRCGVAPATPLPHDAFFQSWLDEGLAASMYYLHRDRQKRSDPRSLLPSAASAVVVAASVENSRQREPQAGEGRVARYARGKDYHLVLRDRLSQLDGWLRQQVGEAIETRIAVDSSPILERELAVRAGLGFIGKNTLLIIPGLGSHTVLGAMLTSLALPPDSENVANHCGSCDLCLVACPADAFVAAYRLDAGRCISYLTIESKEPPDLSTGPPETDWLFGCDACQDVCPYNRKTRHYEASATTDTDLAPDDGVSGLSIAALLSLKSGAYRRLVKGRAFRRVSRPNWQRNAAVVAAADRSCSPAIDRALSALADSPRAGLKETARWARRQREEEPKETNGQTK